MFMAESLQPVRRFWATSSVSASAWVQTDPPVSGRSPRPLRPDSVLRLGDHDLRVVRAA